MKKDPFVILAGICILIVAGIIFYFFLSKNLPTKSTPLEISTPSPKYGVTVPVQPPCGECKG